MRSRLCDSLQRSMQHDEFLVDDVGHTARNAARITTHLHALVHHHGSTITTVISDALLCALAHVLVSELNETKTIAKHAGDARTSALALVRTRSSIPRRRTH